MLTILTFWPAPTLERRARSEEEIRESRRQLMAVRDPRRKTVLDTKPTMKPTTDPDVIRVEDTSDNYKAPGRRSRKNDSPRSGNGNRISTIGRKRSRKRIVKSRPRPGAEEFVPELLKVMNISYQDAQSFRVPATGGQDDKTISKDPVAGTQAIRHTSNDSTKLTKRKNLSYMNSETFRSQDGKSETNNTPVTRKGDKRRGSGRTINKIRRRRVRVNPSQKSNSVNNNNNNNDRDYNDTQLTPGREMRQNMAWVWPVNTIDLRGFNFDLFDSQFSPEPRRSPRQRVLSRVPQSSHQVDRRTGRYTIATVL